MLLNRFNALFPLWAVLLGGICNHFAPGPIRRIEVILPSLAIIAILLIIAIEVGMQNPGLGVALALQFFSASAALPGALFSVWHNVSGSILASKWGKR